MSFNVKVILRILGVLLIINGIFMLLCLPATYYYQNEVDVLPISFSGSITVLAGCILYVLNRKSRDMAIKKRDGYLIVTLGWVVMALSGTLPYILSGKIPSFTDAFFETMSGYTTTGATILTDIEAMPKDILLWRSITHWIGGMGIIVLAVAILPALGIGGMELFMAEAPGISPDKLSPRISDTAKRLWYIYVGITAVEIVALKFAGMSLFDAINHSFATVATGGFSTKNASVAYYSPTIQWIIIFFMIISGINFNLHYFLLKGKIKKVLADEELRFYMGAIFIFSLVIVLFLFNEIPEMGIEETVRVVIFQVSSVLTSTGFATADYVNWGTPITMLFFIMLFSGAMAGSTSGGIKVIRHVVLAKSAWLQLKKQLHPSAILPVRINGKAISPEITFSIISFILVYLLIFIVGSTVLCFFGSDIETSMSAVATCMGNIGPGIANVSPSNNFAFLHDASKWMLSMDMLVGRLELFTVLILFTPLFWRSK